MKLQAELNIVVSKYAENKERIIAYADQLKQNGGYRDFETRLAWDVLRGIFGTSWICDLYDKYDCNDEHISTLAKKAIKTIL